MRYEMRSTDPGYGVWDRSMCEWVEPEFGEATGMAELDAELLLAAVTET